MKVDQVARRVIDRAEQLATLAGLAQLLLVVGVMRAFQGPALIRSGNRGSTTPPAQVASRVPARQDQEWVSSGTAMAP
jgi:hypothetical protein